MMTIAWRLIKSMFKDKKEWVWMFLMPILFTFIFGSMAADDNDTQQKIGLLMKGESTPQGEVLLTQIKDNPTVTFVKGNKKELKKQVKDQKLTGIVKVNQHWTDPNAIPVQLLLQHETSQLTMFKQTLHDQVTDVQQDFNIIDKQGAQKTNALLSKPAVTTVVKNTEGKITGAPKETSMRAVGFIVMFVMITVLTAAGIMLQEKEEGTWFRLQAAPLSAFQITGGYLIGFFLIGLLQFGILVAASSLIFGVHWGNLAVVLAIAAMFLLVAVSFGLLLSVIVKTTRQQQSIGSLLVTATCMLGGVFWPLDVVSDSMQTVAKFVPQYWVLDGMKQVMFNGGRWMAVLPQIGVLALFAVIFFGGSLVLQGVQRKVS